MSVLAQLHGILPLLSDFSRQISLAFCAFGSPSFLLLYPTSVDVRRPLPLTNTLHGSNNTSDPFRTPTASPQYLPVDYSGFIAVVFGIAGVMFRYKLSSWLAIIFSVQLLANMWNVETDLKQISMAMMFAIMGLVTDYFGPARPVA